MRTVRRSLTPDVLRMRIASIITATPTLLSVAPVAACQVSKWPPSMTISSALSVPGSSPTMLKTGGSGWKVFAMLASMVTGMFFASMRAMRP